MSNVPSGSRSRSSSAASQELRAANDAPLSISALRSRFESLAAGKGGAEAGHSVVKKPAANAARARKDDDHEGKVPLTMDGDEDPVCRHVILSSKWADTRVRAD